MNNAEKYILVAEDEEALRGMLVTVLKDEEYQVDSATNGEEAWKLLEKNRYDLLITDLYMPEMDGIELIRNCQASFPDTKLILTSGGGKELEAVHGQKTVKFKGKEVRTDSYIKKPYNLNELFGVIEMLIEP